MNASTRRLADTHCHLVLAQFDKDRIEVIERAQEAGVERILVPGIDLITSRLAVELSQSNANIHAAVGIHPHDARTWDSNTAAEIGELARSAGVVAIGEIGLDYYRNLSTPQQQKHAFLDQLTLAAEIGLPVVIHNREATQDVIENLLQWSRDLPESLRGRAGVLHAYSADIETAHLAAEAGFYFGVAGPVTFRSAEPLREVVSQIPITRLLLETDSPYLTPQPFRGKRNEPAYVRFIAEKFAGIMGINESQAADATWQNAATLFDWNHGNDDRNLL
jgi:TatD DNase family protein